MTETAATRSRIADPSAAPSGHQAIAWARRSSPVLDTFVRSALADGALTGKRLGLIVPLDAKAAFLATVLADSGAVVVAAGSDPLSTRDDVAAALVERGIEVHGTSGSTSEEWKAALLRAADSGPDYIIDDRAQLATTMARDRPESYNRLSGVAEETTMGVARLGELARLGRLSMPVLASTYAQSKRLFENRSGAGQSTVQAILQLTNLRMQGKRVVVVGYGLVGRGVANACHQLGARVTAVEVDPIRALEAFTDGHGVSDLATALGFADVVITATGGVRALTNRHFDALTEGTILANVGHHNHEIDMPALRAEASEVVEIRPGVMAYTRNAITSYVLVDGATVNIAGGVGQPIETMDLSLSVKALGCHYLASNHLPPGIHPYPDDLDRAIALATLDSRGLTIETLRDDQTETLSEALDADYWGSP